jgi:hypothetical protein
MCAWAFLVQVKEQNKEYSENDLYRLAKHFFLLNVKKGKDECPFPEYLVKYYIENCKY